MRRSASESLPRLRRQDRLTTLRSPMSRVTAVLIAGAVALLAVPSLALAHGRHGHHHGYGWTYPHASQLCAKVANGKVPKRLAASTAQVTAACTTLRTSFTDAQNAYDTAITPIKKQAGDAISALRATCKQAKADNDPAACRTAWKATRTTLQTLNEQARAAGKTYREAVMAAR